MTSKLTPDHLRRRAIVYVRQSTLIQVTQNRESQLRQYNLAGYARELGFVDVETIDEDLGRSGSGLTDRPGFQRLVTEVCEGQIGAVFLLALLAWPGHLLRRQPQHCLDRGAPCHIDQFVAGHLALLDEIHHGQQQLPALAEKLGQLLFVGLSLFVNRVIASFHGGSSFQRFGDPILY